MAHEDMACLGPHPGTTQGESPGKPRLAAPHREDGAHQRLSQAQLWTVRLGLAIFLALGVFARDALILGLHAAFVAAFLGVGCVKLAACLPPRLKISGPWLADQDLPPYTVIAPLYREADVAAQLAGNLARLDYPRDRLQALIVLEEDDHETLAAFLALDLPAFIQVLVAPNGAPRTKPRACNVALQRAVGSLVVIFDAEDAPHPLQLREAAARFAAAPRSLACLQAPLRIDEEPDFIRAQFRLEYAAQFEVMLPALARWGLPFPLGGTSNHFRAEALRAVGGWDAYNVTEDADIGFRLAAAGYGLDVISSPTQEPAPQTFGQWIPQRGRWVKGHMQTLAVHLRGPVVRTPRGLAGLLLTLMLSVVSSSVHAPIMAWTLVGMIWLALAGDGPMIHGLDLTVALFGWSASSIAAALGLARTGERARWRDLVGAAAYWPLQSIAAARALWQWIRQPYRWDKTSHAPRPLRPLPGARMAK